MSVASQTIITGTYVILLLYIVSQKNVPMSIKNSVAGQWKNKLINNFTSILI
jgi:hypothetical protein